MTIRFYPGSSQMCGVALEPNDTPLDDVVAAAAAAGGGSKDALARLVSGARVRIAATAARVEALTAAAAGADTRPLSAQPKPFWSHLPVSLCLIDWGEIMHPTYPTECAYVEPKSGRV
jgi:hypothetical protein